MNKFDTKKDVNQALVSSLSKTTQCGPLQTAQLQTNTKKCYGAISLVHPCIHLSRYVHGAWELLCDLFTLAVCGTVGATDDSNDEVSGQSGLTALVRDVDLNSLLRTQNIKYDQASFCTRDAR